MILLLLTGCLPQVGSEPGQKHPAVDTGWEPVAETGCVPDAEPALTAEELVYDPAVVSHFRGASVNRDEDSWDFSGGDDAVEYTLQTLNGFWFADRFSAATHVTPLDLHAENWGIYRADDTGLWLLGVASNTPNWTALVYTPAVTLWETPISAGLSWSTDAGATGMFEGDDFPLDLGFGNEVNLVHHYQVEADGHGDVVVDAGTFEAQRIAIHLDAVGTDDFDFEWGRDSRDTWLFIAPCTGLVARVTDHDYMGLGL